MSKFSFPVVFHSVLALLLSGMVVASFLVPVPQVKPKIQESHVLGFLVVDENSEVNFSYLDGAGFERFGSAPLADVEFRVKEDIVPHVFITHSVDSAEDFMRFEGRMVTKPVFLIPDVGYIVKPVLSGVLDSLDAD